VAVFHAPTPPRASAYIVLCLGSGGDRLNLDYDEILKERGFQVTGPSAKDRAQRGEAGGVGAERRELEVAALYNGPFPRLRSLLCLAQRGGLRAGSRRSTKRLFRETRLFEFGKTVVRSSAEF